METPETKALRQKIHDLALKGREAARNKDLIRSAELARQVVPLLKQLAEASGDKDFDNLAEMGKQIASRYPRPQA